MHAAQQKLITDLHTAITLTQDVPTAVERALEGYLNIFEHAVDDFRDAIDALHGASEDDENVLDDALFELEESAEMLRASLPDIVREVTKCST